MFGILTFAFSASNGQDAAKAPFMLGRGVDITKLDLWTMAYPPGMENDLFRGGCDIKRAGCCRYIQEYGYAGTTYFPNGNTASSWGSTPYEEQRWFYHNHCDDEIGLSQQPNTVATFANCPYTCPGVDVVRANCCATGNEASYKLVNCDKILNGDYNTECQSENRHTYVAGNSKKWDMPDYCWSKESICSGSSSTDTRHFVNTEQAEDYVKKTAGVNTEISAYGVDFTLNTIFDEIHLFGTSKSVAGVFGHDIQINNCFSMRSNCWQSGGYLATGILEKLKTLPKDPWGHNPAILDRWVTDVIAHAGTHLVIGTSNGAAVKYVVYSDDNSRTAVNCADQKICANLVVKLPKKGSDDDQKEKKPVDIDGDNSKACKNDNHQCTSNNSTRFTFDSNCKAVGGSKSSRAGVCTNTGDGYKINYDSLKTHLAAGDTSEASVIEMTLTRLDTVVKKMELEEEVNKASPQMAPHEIVSTLGMAIDYYLCESRNDIFTSRSVWKWNSAGTTKSGCQGTLVSNEGKRYFVDNPLKLSTGSYVFGHWERQWFKMAKVSATGAFEEDRYTAKIKFMAELTEEIWNLAIRGGKYTVDGFSCGSATGPSKGYCENTCDRVCVHGTLDEHTCTCKCLSNSRGGWTGDHCETEYGDVKFGTIELADGTQLFVDSDSWVQAMHEGQGKNTDPARREWAYFYPHLRLRDGRTLYSKDGWAAVSHGHAADVHYDASSKTWQLHGEGQLYVTAGQRWGWGAWNPSGRDTNTDAFRRTFTWGKSMLMCAPGCPSAWVGNGHCETNDAKNNDVCDVPACNYDCGDCGRRAQDPTCPRPPLSRAAQMLFAMHPAEKFNISAFDTVQPTTTGPTTAADSTTTTATTTADSTTTTAESTTTTSESTTTTSESTTTTSASHSRATEKPRSASSQSLEDVFSFEMSFRKVGDLMDRLGQFLTREGFRR